MDVFVYRSTRKNGYYVYLPAKNDFSRVPKPLLDALGSLVFSLEFTLTSQRKLAREDPAQVLENLDTNGFHLQISDQLTTPENFYQGFN